MNRIGQFHTKTIEQYAVRSLLERTKKHIPAGEIITVNSSGDDICRIIYSYNRTFVSAYESYIEPICHYLRSTDISKTIRSPFLYREILDVLNLDHSLFRLEPIDELIQNIHYNCSHTREFVCSKESFFPSDTSKIDTICRGDECFLLDDSFDDTMYCIIEKSRMVGCCFYRPNRGDFQGTCAMQVFTRPEYRRRGYGKMTASAATGAVIKNDCLALWVSQVENLPSIKIAESLGYVLLGGELRITY